MWVRCIFVISEHSSHSHMHELRQTGDADRLSLQAHGIYSDTNYGFECRTIGLRCNRARLGEACA